jgi:hypothetical protein
MSVTLTPDSFQKDPDEVLDYRINWSRTLEAAPASSDTISTSSWAVTSGITVDSDSNTTTTATVFLSGGTAGVCYTITNTITTAGGRTFEASFTVWIRDS